VTRWARLLAVAAAPLLAGTLGAPAAYGQDDPEQELAERYAPVIMLVRQDERCGDGEAYQPSAVDPLFDNPEVALRGPWDRPEREVLEVAPSADRLLDGLRGYSLDMPPNALRPGCDFETWTRRIWGESAEPTIYAHVVTQDGVADRLAAQYFFFYPYNDWNNTHEGDWERIQLDFDTADPEEALEQGPVRATYSQHYGAEYADWGDEKLQIVDETHPVVYVAEGSHASKFGEAIYPVASSEEGLGCDSTIGPSREVRPAVVTIPADEEEAEEQYPWIAFEGHWGEVGPRSIYDGPTGPNMKSQWDKPFDWSAGARSTGFAIPVGQTVGGSGLDFFCDAVERGSQAFLRFSDTPGPVLVLLAVIVVAMVWLVRRTSWDRSAPLPARRRRGIGTIIGSSWAMLTARPVLLLGVTAPSLVVVVLDTLAQVQASTATGPAWAITSMVLSVILAVTVVISQLGTAQVLADLDAGGAPTVAGVLAAATQRLPAAVGTGVIWAIPLGIGVLAGYLVPVALVLLVVWCLVLPIVQLEALWGWRALLRSARLVRGQVGTVVPMMLVGAVLVSLLGGLVAAVLFVVTGTPFGLVTVMPGIVTVLLSPFIGLMTAYAYFNGLALQEDTADAPAPAEMA
jgi:hypothetical protein